MATLRPRGHCGVSVSSPGDDVEASAGGSIGYRGAVSIGVGGMVGGGIFAVLGLAVSMGGAGTFLAFLVAGLVALATTYSYARLSVAIPSQGGTAEFLNEAFGAGRVAGTLNVLLGGPTSSRPRCTPTRSVPTEQPSCLHRPKAPHGTC